MRPPWSYQYTTVNNDPRRVSHSFLTQYQLSHFQTSKIGGRLRPSYIHSKAGSDVYMCTCAKGIGENPNLHAHAMFPFPLIRP